MINEKRVTAASIGPWHDPQGLIVSFKSEGQPDQDYYLLHTMDAPGVALGILDQAWKNGASLPKGAINKNLTKQRAAADLNPLHASGIKVAPGGKFFTVDMDNFSLTFAASEDLAERLAEAFPFTGN